MKLRIKRGTLYEIFEYLFAFALVLNFRSVWSSMPALTWFNYAVLAVFAIAWLGCLASKGNVQNAAVKRTVTLVIVILFYLLVFSLVNPYNRNGLMSFAFMAVMIIAFYFTCYNKKNIPTVLWKYENIIIIIALVSIFFWLFGSMLGIISHTGAIKSNWTGSETLKTMYHYYGIYFQNLSQGMGIFEFLNTVRNIAIFTEAPMASFHFCMALLIELFLKSENKKMNVIILTVVIMTTFSTTGYIIAIVAFLCKYSISGGNRSIMEVIKVLTIPAILIVGGVIIFNLFTSKLKSSSGSIRIDDFIAGYKTWILHPFLGSGYGNNDALKIHMSSFRSNNRGFSNSLMQILAQGGIYFIFPYSLCLLKGMNYIIQTKNWNKAVFCMLFLSMFIFTLSGYQALNILIFIFVSQPTDKEWMLNSENKYAVNDRCIKN